MLYTTLKFVHVIAAIVWVGGAVTLTMLSMQLSRARDGQGQSALGQIARSYGMRVLGPAAGLTLLAGIGTTVFAGFKMNSLWIIWAFVVILLSTVGRMTLMRAMGQRIGVLMASGDAQARSTVQNRMLLLDVVNVLLLISVVWAMIAKPTF